MTRALIVHKAGPGVTVQDHGRPGYLAYGLSRGGAADHLAMAEGAALLRQAETLAALELATMGGTFEASEDMRIALTGAPMPATIDGGRIAWNASHVLPVGARLSIGAAEAGCYGYLHVGGGIETPMLLGARSAHVAAGLGKASSAGEQVSVGEDGGHGTGLKVVPEDRFGGGNVRVVPSLQTDLFAAEEIARFQATSFKRDARGNRMGAKFVADTAGFHSEAGLNILSEIVVPGDIQITGDGTPFVLLCECQTTGGYPRIGSVLPADLPRVAQAQPGETLRFSFISLEDAVAIQARERDLKKSLNTKIFPLIRDPATMTDLLAYQMISGVTAGDDMERSETW